MCLGMNIVACGGVKEEIDHRVDDNERIIISSLKVYVKSEVYPRWKWNYLSVYLFQLFCILVRGIKF